MNIAFILEMAAGAAPDREALAVDGRVWTYAQLLAAARAAAGLFRDAGCRHVALLDVNSEAAVIALFGAALADIPYVPLNYRLADADLSALLDRIEPFALVGDAPRARRLAPGDRNVHLDRTAFLDAVGDARSGEDLPEAEGAGVAVQLFTSGTTAAPKAAILRHANLVSYIVGTLDFGSAEEGDAALVSVPPYHIAGVAAALSSIYIQRRIVILPEFKPPSWLQLARDHRVTNAFVVPTMLSRIVEHIEADGLPGDLAIRAIAYGGGRMPVELIGKALKLFPGTDFTNAYGLTETSSTIAILGPDDHRAAIASADPAVRARLGSVGRPLPSVEIELRNERGEVVPVGEPGEIYVRGDQVSGEYLERSALADGGWFPTRDIGRCDAEGYLFLEGRADDVIVRGGENMSPAEIEDVLLAHPAVADAVAVAIPSDEWGEAVGVALVLRPLHDRPGDEELKELVRIRLRSSRVPERIRFVDEIPYNEMGKVLRREAKLLLAT